MPIDFNKDPYYDDFSVDDSYYRLLFQPGRAVQARELTQIQSYLQSQIEKLGRHLFRDGAQVYGGRLNYDKTDTKWLAVKSQDVHGNPVRMTDISPGMTISKPSAIAPLGAKVGSITSVRPHENNDPNTIYFKWTEGEPDNVFQDGFLAGEHLVISDKVTGRVRYNVTALDVDSLGNDTHYGTSSNISIDSGIYFWKGLFVNAPGGHVNLSKYSSSTTYRVGYLVEESVVQNDPKTLDPASQSRNYSAPGADRYKISMKLIKVGNGVNFDERVVPNFIEIARIDAGNLLSSEDGLGGKIYNILGERLARRTYEESGNYVAQKYDLKLKDKTTSDNPKMIGSFAQGVSYVKGHRHALNYQNSLAINKGRDTIIEEIDVPNNYGDNYLVVDAENANGMFVVGSGAGVHQSDITYGNRGAAVSIHSVPKKLVEDYSLGSADAWNSTLIGTARPIQMAYDTEASQKSKEASRSGDSYDLWLGDFKSSPISGTVPVTNVIELAGAYSNAEHTVFHWSPATAHGLTSDDRISVSGTSATAFNIDHVAGWLNANTTAIVFTRTDLTMAASQTVTGGRILRTTGNNSPYRTVVLETAKSAPWNGSYIGATVQVGNSTPKTIVDYIGTHSDAYGAYNTRNLYKRSGMAILDSDLEELPKNDDTYKLNLTMKQSRSVVYNQNKSATGVDQYPAILNQSWNVDPISGVAGDNENLDDEVYGGRVNGDALFNRYGKQPAGEDALLFDTGRKAVKSLTVHGALDAGFTGNTTVYYTEYSVATRTNATTIQFTPGNDAAYNHFFGDDGTTSASRVGIAVYPYVNATIPSKNQIKENFTLVNRTTGEVLTNVITEVVVLGHNITVTGPAGTFQNTNDYVLNFPVRGQFAKPAYKKLVVANTLIASADVSNMTDTGNGQVLFVGGTYGNTAGSRFNLLKPDGFKLKKVVHQFQNDQDHVDLANTMLDITSRFDFDSGQRDMFYDNASAILKPGVDAPTGNVMFCFDYFQRYDLPKSNLSRAEDIDSPGFFSVDSYQFTTDLTLDHTAPKTFRAGMEVTSNSGVTGYVLDYANTASSGEFAKIRLQDVRGRAGVTNPEFVVGEYITSFDAIAGATVASRIKSVVAADLRYSQIPEYKSSSNKLFPLRNMIDARAYVSTNTMVSDTISNSIMPLIPTASRIKSGRITYTSPMGTKTTQSSFAGRMDKIIITKDGDYTTISGIPSFEKYPPKDMANDQALTLFTLDIPAYTFDTRDVQIVENLAMRHTMKDIGRLAKRVENLEYYVSLNSLEQMASQLDVLDGDGNSRFKNGIVVDNFTSHTVMDTSGSLASLEKGILRPQATWPVMGRIGFDPLPTTDNDTVVKKSRKYLAEDDMPDLNGVMMMLDYTTDAMVTQPIATTSESVNPFDLQNFTGEIELTPDKDNWIDTKKIPEYSSVLTSVYDAVSSLNDDSSAQDIANAFKSMGDFWEDIAGTSLGDDIVGTSVYLDENQLASTVEKNIQLGSTQNQYFNTAQIDAAIENHGASDGSLRNIKILPYIRSRDVVVHAQGLKPNHLNVIRFDDVGVESNFARANEIYMRYDPTTATTKFQPDVNGQYEKIKLTSGSLTANAILIAVREPDIRDNITDSETSKYMIGYIVPELDHTDEDGKINYNTPLIDGYYDNSNWDTDNKIKTNGFQGTNASRTVTGYVTGAVATLITGGTDQHYNGHYTGSARNTGATAANTTHIELSADAWRYVDANIRKAPGVLAVDNQTGYPENCYINIVAGAGAGQQCIANGIVFGSGTAPVIELRGAGTGTTGLTTGINSTSVYSLSMKSVDPALRAHGVTQIGDIPGKSNSYGEKIGVLRIPSTNRVRFTAGRKLVEIMDRYSKEEWLISSYASAYYEASVSEQEVVEDPVERLNLLKDIRSKVSGFRLSGHPDDLSYVPAKDIGDNKDGRLAVVKGITFDHPAANNTWTALGTDGVAFVRGGGEFGTIDLLKQNDLREDLSGVWKELRDNHPEIYAKYFSMFGN